MFFLYYFVTLIVYSQAIYDINFCRDFLNYKNDQDIWDRYHDEFHLMFCNGTIMRLRSEQYLDHFKQLRKYFQEATNVSCRDLNKEKTTFSLEKNDTGKNWMRLDFWKIGEHWKLVNEIQRCPDEKFSLKIIEEAEAQKILTKVITCYSDRSISLESSRKCLHDPIGFKQCKHHDMKYLTLDSFVGPADNREKFVAIVSDIRVNNLLKYMMYHVQLRTNSELDHKTIFKNETWLVEEVYEIC
ncbi:unnamed protein product [Caenorhabditis angaria]|uniref:DUF38 domain-containing protein n=1 Tax=Caenorhabditis angaria TaxID=860376 RepID=A0A9P1N9G7_9PELO|nr:unnamed protein product [Caenorhabditis angaria]